MIRTLTLALLLAPALAGAAEHIELTLSHPDGRAVPVKAVLPEAAGAHPLVVFSHGAFSSKDEYDRLADAWADAGYAVLLPTHIDSTTMGAERGRSTSPDAFAFRLADMALIVDALEADAVPELAGRIDADRVAAAGHSFGGLVAQALTGAVAAPGMGQEPQDLSDPRFDVAIVLMAPGALPPMIAAEGFQGVGATPQVVFTGTSDLTVMVPDGDWTWRRQAYDLLPAGDKYGVTLTDSDHYLGGLICRPDVPGPEDAAGVDAVNRVAIAFLDAYLRDDATAMGWLASVDLAEATDGKALIDRK